MVQDTVLFVTLAMNQTRFYAALGAAMARTGRRVRYLCFHERSHEWLTGLQERSFNAFARQPKRPDDIELSAYHIANAHLLLQHEKAAYEIYDTRRLLRKLKGHLYAVSSVLTELEQEASGKIHMVQELGGFLSVLAAYFGARARGVDNWFIEPSFYRKRVFLTRNSLAAPVVPDGDDLNVEPDVIAYLDHAKREQSVVIPAKDRHHYRRVAAKLFDARNVRRLVEKTWDIYVLGKREEFEYPAAHARRHVRMFVNHRRLRRHYRPIPDGEHYVYYPLHVPADFALTIRSPQYLDQYALVDYLCRSAPDGRRVLIKEHPALVGAVSYARICDLLRQHDNLVLLDPGINNYDVIAAADAVVTVNSKSGAEALLLGKPLVALGDAFYRGCRQTISVERLADLPAALDAALERGTGEAVVVHRYFQNVWNSSLRGELYDVSEGNITAFAASLDAVLSAPPEGANHHDNRLR
jgi:hypothetical protein